MKNKIIILVLVFSVLLSSGFGCKYVSKEVQEKMKPIEINYWRVFDGPDTMAPIIAMYKELHPFVRINYTKLRYEEYEEKLIEAFATDRGPDIFTIHNTWMKKYQSKGLIAPMPAAITMAYPVTKGSIKKEVIPELRTTKSITLNEVKKNFFDVVYNDVVIDAQDPRTGATVKNIYGLPLFIDTMAMFYNKDLFNNAGITTPPEYWNKEFQQDVKKLTKQDNKGQIIQSGVALGGGNNIERASDILSLLMMQNGTEMVDERGQVKFNLRPENIWDRTYVPGLDALRFYTDFANPAKEVYSWNKNMDNSIDLFTQGKLAIILGYSYMLPDIRSRAPKLNFGISKIPQIEGNPQNINFANYWVEVVSKKSRNIDTAWDFVQFITKKELAASYLAKAKKPTALRSLVESQIDDQDLGVFAEQLLTADSWYRGYDADAMESIMKEMIESVISGQYTLDDAIKISAGKVQQTYREQN